MKKLAEVKKLLLKEWGDLVNDIIYLNDDRKMRVRFKEPLDDAFPIHFHNGNQQNVIEPPFPIKRQYLDDSRSFIFYILSILTAERL